MKSPAPTNSTAASPNSLRNSGFGPHAVRQQKRLLNKWFDMTVHGAIEDGIEQFGLAFLTGEPQHQMQQFRSRKSDKR